MDMFKITEAQTQFFRDKHIGMFRDKMLRHFAKRFAEETKHLNQNQLARFIVDGIEEAERYQIYSQQDVCVFLNIKILLQVYKARPVILWFAVAIVIVSLMGR